MLWTELMSKLLFLGSSSPTSYILPSLRVFPSSACRIRGGILVKDFQSNPNLGFELNDATWNWIILIRWWPNTFHPVAQYIIKSTIFATPRQSLVIALTITANNYGVLNYFDLNRGQKCLQICIHNMCCHLAAKIWKSAYIVCHAFTTWHFLTRTFIATVHSNEIIQVGILSLVL